MKLERSDLARAALVVALAGCTGEASTRPAPAHLPPPPRAPEAPAPDAPPAFAPSHIEAVASDPWGRHEGLTVPAEALSACIRDAAAGTAGWLLIRVEYEVLPRPTRTDVLEREGLTEPMASCIVAAIASHDELEHMAPSRLVYVTAW